MKRTSLIIVLIFSVIFAKESFASSGWQFGLNIPIGASFGFYKVSFSSDAPQDYKDGYVRRKSSIGFDAGLTLQVGYLIGDGEKGISLLADLGYSHDTFAISGNNTKEYYTFENMQIGILPKFHKGNYAVGFGIGIKIPFQLIHTSESYVNNVKSETTTKYSVDQMNNVFKDALITYVKFSFDYSFYLSSNIAILFGVYIGGDFNLDLRGAELRYVEKRNLSSLDVGLQLGVKLGNGI